MHLTHSRQLSPRSGWRLFATVYTVVGAICVLACAALPDNELAMLAAIAGGLPWSLSLLALQLAPGFAALAVVVLALAWALNAALLWWLALRPRAGRANRQ
jgi:hypothetical protein